MIDDLTLKSLSPASARLELINILQRAHAGEYAAALAYDGHARSIHNAIEQAEVNKIKDEELDHREHIASMLEDLGSGPDVRLEKRLTLVGKLIGFLCFIGGWYIPMYGAGKLERGNIGEYEQAARLAHMAGEHALVKALIQFAEIEWDHELYFRTKVYSHWLRYIIRPWGAPPARSTIQSSFNQFLG